MVFATSNDWGSGQVPSITLRNTGSSPIDGWTVTWTESNDVALSNSWSTTLTQSGRNFQAAPVGYNQVVPANGRVSFGMPLGYSGATPLPLNLKWAGRNCTIAVN